MTVFFSEDNVIDITLTPKHHLFTYTSTQGRDKTVHKEALKTNPLYVMKLYAHPYQDVI